jgi:pyridoxamine 5'-phosphate oxidase
MCRITFNPKMSNPPKKDLDQERREYQRGVLEEGSLPDHPMELFELWMSEARSTNNPDPTAMTLSTVDSEGNPSSRMVLLKAVREGTFIFFTNHMSRKGKELASTSKAALHFYWPELERQVRVEGKAAPLDESDSTRYFRSRPYESQIGAWASPQSTVIPNRHFLETEFEKYHKKFQAGSEVPKPAHWGGYAITPSRMEFWQGGLHRLHDRIEYKLIKNSWARARLAP